MAVSRIARPASSGIQLPIIGIGGVSTWEDAAEMIIAGATGVGVCTAAMVEGPRIFRKLVTGLDKYLNEQKVTMDELRGTGIEGMRQVNEMALQPLLVTIEPSLCNQCNICQTVCPVQAVRQGDGYNYIVREECINCGFCVANCPENAITVAVAG
jgi:dihydroorotate dehydrogenase (NAD+) catalytic subunit